jgi:hypothetical protein
MEATMTLMTLSERDLLLFKRLQNGCYYWIVYGPSLDRLIEHGLAEVDGGINDRSIGIMYNKVSLTEKGREVLRSSAQ